MQVNIGEKIKELRKKNGRKQEDLATALGVTPQAISRWEANGGYPDMGMIPAIANYFHITIAGHMGDYEAAASYFDSAFEHYQKFEQWRKGLRWGAQSEENCQNENREECFSSSILSSVKPATHKVIVCEPQFLEMAIRFLPEEEKRRIMENSKYSVIFNNNC